VVSFGGRHGARHRSLELLAALLFWYQGRSND
jgi:hypothetical protein